MVSSAVRGYSDLSCAVHPAELAHSNRGLGLDLGPAAGALILPYTNCQLGVLHRVSFCTRSSEFRADGRFVDGPSSRCVHPITTPFPAAPELNTPRTPVKPYPFSRETLLAAPAMARKTSAFYTHTHSSSGDGKNTYIHTTAGAIPSIGCKQLVNYVSTTYHRRVLFLRCMFLIAAE